MVGYFTYQRVIFLVVLCSINKVSSLLPLKNVGLIENIPLKDVGLKENLPLEDVTIIENIISQYKLPSLVGELSKFNEDDVKNVFEDGHNDEDKYLNITELIVKYGYQVETHRVQTEDGYILTIYRIPGSGEPVMLQHGLFSSALDWVTSGHPSSLAYLLADRGHDVWLPNLRGSVKESQGHAYWSAESDPQHYWNFSWDESGRYDLPAIIDYVLLKTKKSKLKIVGHSQGTTVFFVLCSVRPEYNAKISLMVALSPVAWMSHLVSPLPRLIAPLSDLHVVLDVVGLYKFNFNKSVVKFLKKLICSDLPAGDFLCDNITFLFFGFSYAQINLPKLPVIFAHAPSAASTRMNIHYGQLINSGKFRQFDYGYGLNLKKYGCAAPPDYPVANITAPVALCYSAGDWFSAEEDVNILRSKLPNVIEAYKVPFKPFCHSDFLFAKDVKELLYDKVISLIEKADS